MNLLIEIKITPTLNFDNLYGGFLSAQIQGGPDTISHDHDVVGGTLERVAKWASMSIEAEIIRRGKEMQDGKSEFIAEEKRLGIR